MCQETAYSHLANSAEQSREVKDKHPIVSKTEAPVTLIKAVSIEELETPEWTGLNRMPREELPTAGHTPCAASCPTKGNRDDMKHYS